MSDTIEISFGIDNGYASHAAVTARSVVDHAPGADIRFTIIHSDVTLERQRMVESCVPKASFRWLQVDRASIGDLAGKGHISEATYFRLKLPSLLPQTRRIIHLDCDLVVVDDVRTLWSASTGAAGLAAVCDSIVDPVEWAKSWNLPTPPDRYFNAGVLVIDLDRQRETGAFGRVLDRCITDSSRLKYSDQCALNIEFWGQWAELDWGWNVQRNMVLEEAPLPYPGEREATRRRPRIVHYTGPHKPWQRTAYHPYAGLYWDVLRRTPFEREVATKSGVSSVRQLAWRMRWWANAAAFSVKG